MTAAIEPHVWGAAAVLVAVAIAIVWAITKLDLLKTLTLRSGQTVLEVQGDVKVRTDTEALRVAGQALELAGAHSDRILALERRMDEQETEIARLRAREQELLREIEKRDDRIAELTEELHAVRKRLAELTGEA